MLCSWWGDEARQRGIAGAAALLLQNLWGFARDSTPERRRQRYGDMEYDWDHRVDTTGGTVGWRTRLIGVFLSPYQPTDPALFQEMMASLPIEFNQFTFVDLGSGKGRTLLMASEYPFGRILGVEMISELHAIAKRNLAGYKSESRKCFAVEAVCGDASEFSLPAEPLVLYLFNPLPEAALRRAIVMLDTSLRAHPRRVYVLYHNPLLEHVLGQSAVFVRVGGTEQYSIYSAGKTGQFGVPPTPFSLKY